MNAAGSSGACGVLLIPKDKKDAYEHKQHKRSAGNKNRTATPLLSATGPAMSNPTPVPVFTQT